MTKNLPMYIAVHLENSETRDRCWLSLPASQKQFNDALLQIGAEHEDFNVIDYAYNVPMLRVKKLMRTALADVNYLASRLSKLTETDVSKLYAICETDYYFDFIGQYIDYTFKPGDYTLLPGITDAEMLGAYYIGSKHAYIASAKLKRCIDRREFGKNLAASENGVFTAHGYVTSKTNWSINREIRIVPDRLNLKGHIGEDIYGERPDEDWEYA